MPGADETPHSAQPTAPYLDAAVAYGLRGPSRFHVPGHKGGPGADPGLRGAIGDRALALDVPPDPPFPEALDRAEALAAEAYGAGRTWFLTNGSTQGNHALCLALAPLGASVVVQRNSHSSMVDGLVLSGGIPSFVAPGYDDDLGIATVVSPESLAAALAAARDARTAFVVSPTYYGMCADVAGCAEAAHAAGVALVVDQAWGPHFGFHPAVPESALRLGADAVITSTHKTAGSLGQSAMLHVAAGGRVDPRALARTVRLVRSTSLSSLLMASLDAARRRLAVHGESLLARTLAAGARAREAVAAAPGCALVGEDFVGRLGVTAADPLRIVIDVRDTGCTGYQVAAELRATSDLHVELATDTTVLLVLGIEQPAEPLELFAHDFAETVRRMPGAERAEAPVQPPAAPANQTVLSPREAFLGPSRVVPISEAVGEVSCESIAGYPPGIPALLPGERISAEVIGYLHDLAAAGARLYGASDPAFETIEVVAE